MRHIFLFAAFLISLVGFGQKKYAVSDIPEALKSNVNVVIREDHMTYKLHSASKATLSVHQVITILNEAGKRYAREMVGYDKLSKVTTFKGVAYDANGAVIKKLKSSEIYDQSAFDGFSLYSDNRFKSADLSHGSYPYTVEFEYEVEFKYVFIIPGSYVLPGEKVSVQNFSYTLVYPTTIEPPRYKAFNIEQEPIITQEPSGFETVKWGLQNIMPITFEPHGPPREELLPHIIAAPTVFEFDNYKGTMESWDNLGQWISSLNKGRNDLLPETQEKIKEITANLKTKEEKVKAVYEYLQNKTRYVSIQLGIGGFQPFEASMVDKTGYGDCKALSNYMVSMLEAIDIKAYYTLIKAGEGATQIKTDFPSSQFNHVVVFVPNGTDTLWLECTSQTNPFGYMGSFTGNRKALAITDDGAKLVHTPVYTEKENLQIRTAEVIVGIDGNAKAKVQTVYSGLQYENDNLNFILGNPEEEKKWTQKTTQIPSFDINNIATSKYGDKIPSAKVNLDLTLKRLVTVSGKRLFLTPNLMNRSVFIPDKVEERKTNVFRHMGYTDIDSVRYKMPEGIYPEFLPEPTRITSSFGEYETSVQIDRGDVLYVRKLKVFEGEFPAKSYTELVDFFKSINKADHGKLVFLTKT
ncbi:MAG: DUF3857 domain-containing transglutaminase family protein [Cyclobacteriaceae bacterium]|nr:MAG: DUF3857 domain-containing transglutaminase family protein [Cyclobacteriaceae bacterium]